MGHERDIGRARELAAAWAAITLVAAFWIGVRQGAPPDDPALCAHPHEVETRAGHTRVVGCGAAHGAPLRGATRLLFGEPLDLNRAPIESLEVLPGIGPVRAAAIVAERERRPFALVAELRAVPGIGPRTVARLEGWVAVAVPVARAGVGPDG